MGKSIDERSHEAIRAYLKHRGIEVLEEGWAHGSDSCVLQIFRWGVPQFVGARECAPSVRAGRMAAPAPAASLL